MGQEALERAKAEDKPMLVSIGYSACHWCHVMAHESFEDPATADLMNERFVNIKVDREERPDIDSLYMTAVQAMTGQGGWPLNVFMTPDGVPFYGGTYWPPEDRMGVPRSGACSMRWPIHGQTSGTRSSSRGSRFAQPWHTARLDPPMAEMSNASRSSGRFSDSPAGTDPLNGGFGGAPKFPQAPVLSFLLHAHHLLDDRGALTMAVETLDKMARGGIYDQIGGGFHRYAVDNVWLVPHFEKMLYDNAQLAQLYLDAYRVPGRSSTSGLPTRRSITSSAR